MSQDHKDENTESHLVFTEGTRVSHYRILRKIGSGGMGEVYLAHDTELDRRVALKFLPAQYAAVKDFKARFKREAKAAAALDHPNIVTIHEVGEHGNLPFYAMQFVDGQPLREFVTDRELSLDDIIKLVIDICEGLQEAHIAGIVHRDIKPANVLIGRDGRPKILDFGLATIQGEEQLTATGSTLGTASYMSPEQVEGKAVDRRTDLFSLGVVLYELIAGRRPFKRDNNIATLKAIVEDTPEPLARYRADVPESLQSILDKALDKDPETRYQSAADLMADLKRLQRELGSNAGASLMRTDKSGRTVGRVLIIGSALVAVFLLLFFLGPWRSGEEQVPGDIMETGSAAQPSIAVLPFADLSAAGDQEYFCDGMAEEIISALTTVSGLRVVARTSSFAFRGAEVDIREIGHKLNVQAVLEGSVRKAGDRFRITAQLINVADGYHLWSERYEQKMEDIFAIQDSISRAIVRALEIELLGSTDSSLARHHTASLEAYNLYLKGRNFWNRRTGEDLSKAIHYFESAIECDSSYALAYAGLADCYNMLGFYDLLPSGEVFPRAKEAAERAISIDSTLGEAHTSLAHVREFYDWDWEGAEAAYRRAIELNPGYATGHQWYGEFLAAMGRFDESMEEFHTAQELDPLSPIIGANLAGSLFLSHRLDQAIQQYEAVLEFDPGFVVARRLLAYVLAYCGQHAQAIAHIQQVAEVMGEGSPHVVATFGYIHASAGRATETRVALAELQRLSRQQYVSPYQISQVYMALGDNNQALDWLEKAYDVQDPWLVFLKVNPMFDNMRSEPRFAALLEKMNLDD